MADLPAIRRAVPDDLAMLIELHRQFCELDQHPFTERRVRAGFVPLLDGDEHGHHGRARLHQLHRLACVRGANARAGEHVRAHVVC